MARLPDDTQLGNLPSANSGRQVATFDTTAIGRGMQNLGQGLTSAGASIDNVADREAKQRGTLQTVGAMSGLGADMAEVDNQFQQDRDQDAGTYGTRGAKLIDEKWAARASAIADPYQREMFRARTQDDVAKAKLRLEERGKGIIRETGRAEFVKSVDGFVDQGFAPGATEDVREKALSNRSAAIDAAKSNGLITPAEAIKLKEQGSARAADLEASELVRTDPERAQRLFRGDAGEVAATLLRKFEGFRGSTYWDVNHHRVGYGSDTITKADGTVERVEKGVQVSKADAERDLARRVAQAEERTVASVGQAAWSKIPSAAKGALLSVAYNYGSLDRAGITAAVKTGDPEQIAEAVEGLKGHNDGVNSKRRQQEADVIRSGAFAGTRLSALTPEKQQQYANQADQQLRQSAAEAARVGAQRAEAYERSIIDGSAGLAPLPARATIENAEDITLSQKNTLLRQHDSATKEVRETDLAARRVVSKIETGEVLNPRDKDDKDGLAALDKRTGVNAGLQNMDTPSQSLSVRQFATTGMVADTQRGVFEGMIRSGSPQQLEFAMSTLDSMYRANPNSFVDAFGKDTFGNLQAWQSRVDRNPTEFRAWLKDASDPAKQKAREGLEKDARKIVDKQDNGDILHRFDAHTWIPGVGDPNAPVTTDRYPGMAVLKQEYSEAFVEGYAKNGGDEPQAHEYATRVMKQSWADSKLGGNKMMKFAPELVLPTYDGSHAWAQKQIDDAVGKLTGSGRGDATTVVGRIQNSPLGRAEADLFGRRPEYALVPTPETKAEIDALRSGRGLPNGRLSPAWRLMYRDAGTGEIKDGGWFYFDAKGERDARAKDLNKQRGDAIAADDKAGALARERLGPYNERQGQMRQLSEKADPSRANRPTWSSERKLKWEADMADKERRDSEGSP